MKVAGLPSCGFAKTMSVEARRGVPTERKAIAFSKFGDVATPLDERFEQLDRFWQRWKGRDSFGKASSDGGSGPDELKDLSA